MKPSRNRHQTRRSFLTTSSLGAASVLVAPALARRVLGAPGPNARIQVAQIGCGRMGSEDMKGVMAHGLSRVVAVCDLDQKRREAARLAVVEHYRRQGEAEVEVKAYADYREVLARRDVDAVVVSPPDHWHAQVAIEAALAGKNLYVQKPLTYDIAEAMALRKAVRARKVILQVGSQQRSENPWNAFRLASEVVRNGRIGKVHTVKVGIGIDRPSGKAPMPMPVPPNLDYERWLGPAPDQPYMEGRVHPQNDYGRPGWITTEDFGLGMITNWGAHHVDIGLWSMGMELSGPTSVTGKAGFMKNDLWTVHDTYHVELGFASGATMILDNSFENGLRFEGSEGWVFCSRGSVKVTSSDGNASEPLTEKSPLRASDPKLLGPLPQGATRWMPSPDHYLNWLEGDSCGQGSHRTGGARRAEPRGLCRFMDRHEARSQADVGPRQGGLRRRRGSQCPLCPEATQGLRARAAAEAGRSRLEGSLAVAVGLGSRLLWRRRFESVSGSVPLRRDRRTRAAAGIASLAFSLCAAARLQSSGDGPPAPAGCCRSANGGLRPDGLAKALDAAAVRRIASSCSVAKGEPRHDPPRYLPVPAAGSLSSCDGR